MQNLGTGHGQVIHDHQGAGMVVRPLEAAEWDAFLAAHGGTYCHSYGWKRVIERSYGLRCHYLGAYASGKLCAVLPVAELPHLPWAPRRAVSLPYCIYGGPVISSNTDHESAVTALVSALVGLGVRQVELREMASGALDTEEVSLHLPLPTTADELWRSVGDKVRNQVRKARKCGLETRWGRDQGDELYAVYAASMGRLGSPVHARAFILGILEEFPTTAKILTVRHDERPIGAMLVMECANTWVAPFASSLAKHRSSNPDMLLYWEAMRAACEAGTKVFDMGRSRRGSGTHSFKRQWGAHDVPLHYHSFHDGAHANVASTIVYRSKTALRLAKLWTCIPFSLQKILGPPIRKWVP